MELNFKKKIVLITGATNGIGKKLAEDFEKSGAILILTGTKPEQIKNLNRNLVKKNKNNIKYYCVNFLEENSLKNFILEFKKYERIDVCINNAGINKIDYFWEVSQKDWDNIMVVNLRSPFLLSQEVSKIMKKNKYGRIVNMASIFGKITRGKRTVYTSSKSGLIGMTKTMAVDLAPFNILVNCVSPGFVLTDLTKKILTSAEIKDLESKIPLGRLAAPEDISKIVLFLASDLNTYISGQNIIVDGGYVNI